MQSRVVCHWLVKGMKISCFRQKTVAEGYILSSTTLFDHN